MPDMKAFTWRHTLISFLQGIDMAGIRKIAYYLPGIIIPKPKSALIIKTLYGFKLWIDPVKDQGIEKSLYYTGTYEKGTLFILRALLKEGDLMVDVGANIGLMSIFAADLVKESGKVIAFEPNPDTTRSSVKTWRLMTVKM
jgi:hypothetical protein